MNSRRAVAVAGAVSIALAGCGGSSNKQLSYSDFVSKANALCRKGQAEFTTAQTPDKAKPVLEKYLKKFKDLKPPDQLKTPYDRFVSITERQLDALSKNDIAGFNKLNAESDRAAAEMGTQDCISK